MNNQWNRRWDTGISVLDAQHQEISMHITQLCKILETTTHQPNQATESDADECAHYAFLFDSLSTGELAYELERLITRIEEHFLFEERLHREASYELAMAHKQAHDAFIQRVNKYYAAYYHGDDVAEKLVRIIVKWFEQHVINDIDFAEMIKRHKIAITPTGTNHQGTNTHNWLTRSLKSISKWSNKT